jgi:tetratricopeptide (TPR) repeat protein
VVLPELDDSYFSDPNQRGFPPGRPASPGMSVRQLAPFFALAKGSEATAIEARRISDDAVFSDQIAKAVNAYMDIVAMADAGNEAREEAWYGVARCEYRRDNWWKAFDALERSFPPRFDRSEVAGRIRLEMFIGERLWRLGGAEAPGAFSEGRPLTGYQAASRVYAAAVFNQPTTRDAPLALLRRGDAAVMEEDWEAASRFYRQVIEYYPESEPAMQARSSLAETVLRRYPGPGGVPEAARQDLGLIMDDVERGAAALSGEALERRQRAVSAANDLEAETRLRQAREYLKNIRVGKSRDAAVFLLGDIVSRFPGTPQSGEAADLLRGMGIEPPMILTDGSRFPMTSGWSGGSSSPLEGGEAILPGGGVELLPGGDAAPRGQE